MRLWSGFLLALGTAVALVLVPGCGVETGGYCQPCLDKTVTGPGRCEAGLVCVRTTQQGGYLDKMPGMTCMHPGESSWVVR